MDKIDTPASRLPSSPPVPELVALHARNHPGRPALIHGERTVSWQEMAADMNRIANALIGLGVGKGDRVALLSRNSLEYSESFLGVLAAGACAVPLPTMVTPEAVELMLRDSGAKVLLVSAACRKLVEERAGALGGLLPGGRIGLDFEAEGWTGLARWRAAAPDSPPDIEIKEDDDFNIIYSSGTTGVPKGILHSHGVRAVMGNGMMLLGFDRDTVNLVSTPLYSNTTITAWLPTVYGGGANLLMEKFDALGSLQLIARHRVSHSMMVPVQYERIMQLGRVADYDLSSLRLKLCTSAPLRYRVKKWIVDNLPGEMIEIYGLTEGGVTTMLDANRHPDKLESVGRPVPGCELKVIDEQGRELGPGQTGEIVGRAPFMMLGYVNRAQETRDAVWLDGSGKPFIRSGDIGRIDEDGFLFLSDRKKDVIISGGLNIYASDLELVLNRHPAVLDAAVIGVPSEKWGEEPLGLVVIERNSGITESELLEWANQRLGKSQRLARIELRERLPKSDLGKTLKRQLRDAYWK
jgi:acyl-CoA synthetase (AMP-forming)/AMP-acid ligase II